MVCSPESQAMSLRSLCRRSSRLRIQLAPGKLQHSLNAVSNVKLPHDARHVMLYSSLSALAASRDLFVGHAPRHKREDFLLAGSKIMGIVDDFDPLALLDQQPRREVRLHIGAASKDGLHRLDHLGSASGLQNVAPRTCLQRRDDILLVL